MGSVKLDKGIWSQPRRFQTRGDGAIARKALCLGHCMTKVLHTRHHRYQCVIVSLRCFRTREIRAEISKHPHRWSMPTGYVAPSCEALIGCISAMWAIREQEKYR